MQQKDSAKGHAPGLGLVRKLRSLRFHRDRITDAIGNRIIHPYSDFLMHDIGSGDGIPVLPGADFAATATQIRTAPLWALRTRNRLMHDGLSFTKQEAISRHAGQATAIRTAFDALSVAQKDQVMAFLDSL